MDNVFIYMLQVNISLMVACLVYFLLLRNLTFFQLNRVYLLTAIVLSTTVPFIIQKISIENETLIHTINTYGVNWQDLQQTITVPNAEPSYSWKDALLLGYWIGVLAMSILFLMQIWSLFKIHKSAQKNDLNPDIFFSETVMHPFSFLKNIYIHPSHHSNEEMATIIHHERIHTSGLHSLDLIIAEINKIFFWFNPGAWMMKLAITENLEFIADQLVLQKGNDKKQYQYQLLKALVQKNALNNSIANQFSFIQLKNRIRMMNKKNSSAYNRLRYALTIPMLVVVSILFANKSSEREVLANAYNFLITQDTVVKSSKNYTHIKVIKTDKIHVAMAYNENGKEIEKIDFKKAKQEDILVWNKKYGNITPPIPPQLPIASMPACTPAPTENVNIEIPPHPPVAPNPSCNPMGSTNPVIPNSAMKSNINIYTDEALTVEIDPDPESYSYQYDSDDAIDELESEENKLRSEDMNERIKLFKERQIAMQAKIKSQALAQTKMVKNKAKVSNEKIIAMQLEQIAMQQAQLAQQQAELVKQRKELIKEAQIRNFKASNSKNQQPKLNIKSNSSNIEVIESDDEE